MKWKLKHRSRRRRRNTRKNKRRTHKGGNSSSKYKIPNLRPAFVPYTFELLNAGLSSNTNTFALDFLQANPSLIDWNTLSANPASKAIYILSQNLDKINISALSANPSALPLLEAHLDSIDWHMLSFNPNAMHLLQQNPDKISWEALSANPNPIAVRLLSENRAKIDVVSLAKNESREAMELILPLLHDLHPYDRMSAESELSRNPYAVPILEQNPDMIFWSELSSNPNALHILEANMEQVDLEMLCVNPNPDAMRLLRPYIHKIKLNWLFSNPNAISFLEEVDSAGKTNLDKAVEPFSQNPAALTHIFTLERWVRLASNPGIFEKVPRDDLLNISRVSRQTRRSLPLDMERNIQSFLMEPNASFRQKLQRL